MSQEIRDLTAMCYETQKDVAVLKESYGATRTLVEKIAHQLEKPLPVAQPAVKTWHLVVITGIYSVISVLPHDKFLDFVLKAL